MIDTDVILNNLSMANKLAHRYAAQQPRDRDEILSAAYYGLVKAARKARPKNTYVAQVVRGAIQNALHAQGSLTRGERDFLARYLDQHGNMADRADALGLPHEYVFSRLARMAFVFPLYRDCVVAAPPTGELEEILEVCLQYLPQRLHWTFLFKYRDQLTLAEIASRTGLAKSTVHQQLRRALRILRQNKDQIADVIF